MLKSEWRSILKNRFLIIVLSVMVLIPALYNIIFLGSMWDPYGHIDKLPVAFVNNDQAAEFQGKTISLGKNLENKLREKKTLDFHFVSESNAAKGIDSGKYYMVVTVPADFSENATTLLTNEPKQMMIDYQTTQGKNLTASKMTSTAMAELKNQVSGQVTAMYTETLLSQFGKAGAGMKEAASGSEKLSTGVSQLSEASETISENLGKLSESSLTFSEGAQKLTVGLEQYAAGVAQANTGAEQLSSGLSALTANIPNLVSGVSQLQDGSQTLKTGLSQYTAGVSGISSASQQLSSGLSQLSDGLPDLTNGVTILSTGSETLNTGLQQYTSGVASANTGASQVADGLSRLTEQTRQLPSQVHTLHEGTQALLERISGTELTEEEKNQLLAYSSSVEAYLARVSSVLGNTDLNSLTSLSQSSGALQAVNDDVAMMSSAVESLSQQTESAKQAIQAAYNQDLTNNAAAVAEALIQSGAELTEEQRNLIYTTMQNQTSQTLAAADTLSADVQTMTSLLAEEQTNLADLKNALTVVQNVPIEDLINLRDTADLLAGSSSIATQGLSRVINGYYELGNSVLPAVTSINQGAAQLDASMPVLTNSLQQLSGGSKQVSEGIGQLEKKHTDLLTGSGQLSNGLSNLNQNAQNLVAGVDNLASGSVQLNSGANQLTEKSTDLNRGANQLTDGLSEAADKLPALSNGAAALSNGSKKLAGGTAQLQENSSAFLVGSAALSNGAQQMTSGSEQLVAGEQKVADSFDPVKAGLTQLKRQLGDGAEKIEQINIKENAAEAIAVPVAAKHTDKDQVANNGTAMAPYMMSVALFVGTLTVNMMFDAFTPKKKPTTGIAWWGSKMSVLGVISVLQALLVYAVLTGILGMAVLSPFKVIGFLILESLTFMSIVTLFNLLLGKAGAFLMLIFMMLQLAGSGGTYPIQLSNGFYETISPLLPMTYSIRALREGISIGGSMLTETFIFLILLIVSNSLMIFYFNKKKDSSTITSSFAAADFS